MIHFESLQEFSKTRLFQTKYVHAQVEHLLESEIGINGHDKDVIADVLNEFEILVEIS